MLIQKNKKGQAQKLMTLVLAVVVVFIIIFALVFKVFDIGGILGGQQTGLKQDSDKDGIVDGIEVKTGCPCTSGEFINDGCPAGFTEDQKKLDRQQYNTDTGCGVLEVPTGEKKEAKPLTEEQKAMQEFKHYRSLEIFGGDDGSADSANAEIRLACANWVGQECPTEDNDCDGDEFNYDSTIKNGCWVMASEDDDFEANDCGQAKVDDGKIISAKEFSDLSADITNNYFSRDKEDDPKNLFLWKWKSKPEYGSLICHEGFWFGCKEANEGKEFPALINNQKYKCVKSEWAKT